MQEPKRLKPYMQVCFTEAKKALRNSECLGLSIGVVAVAAVFIPEKWDLLAWGGGVASLFLLAAQQHQSVLLTNHFPRCAQSMAGRLGFAE